MGALRTYSKAVHDESGWWGTFPLDLPLKAGDVLQFDSEDRMKRVNNLLTLPGWSVAMPVDSEPVESATSWSRHAAKTLAGAVQGGATSAVGVGANATVKVSFSEAGGFLLEYVSGYYHKLRDVAAAQNAILGFAKNGQWKSENVLVTEVVEANPATILISSVANSSIVLSASASLPFNAAGNLAGLNLGDPRFGFFSTSQDTDVYQSVSELAYPLFHCIRIRRKWWGGRYAELQGAAAVNLDEAFADSPFDEDV